MRDALSRRDLSLRGPDVVRDLCALDERLVFLNAQENRCAASMLRENQRPPGGLDLLDERRDIRAEF